MNRTRFKLPRTVVLLGLVSLMNDTASEMIAPLLPVFLTAVLGAGPAAVGLVEGSAEAAASLLKLVSGRLADAGWGRKGLVVSGYSLSNLARPLIGLALSWEWVLSLRFLDRVGKGLRTAPRDAMLGAAVDAGLRGRAFGFHRALDHAGAMVGPVIAFALLQAHMDMRHVFVWSVVPGLLVLVLLVAGVERPPALPRQTPPPLHWGRLDRRLRGLVLASGMLALATAPEAFLVLWAEQRGLRVVWIPLLWAAAHGVKAVVAAPAGALSDRLGRLAVMVGGWVARIIVLVLLALWQDGPWLVWALFLAYAAALACSEGAERALVGDAAPVNVKATAFGLYHLVCGLAALPGAVLFGLVWEHFGMDVAFLVAAGLTAAAAGILLWVARSRRLGRP